MDRLVTEARELCKMDAYGGRVHVVPDMQTLLLYDVAYVPHDFVDRMRGCKVEIVAETTSLSGFVVRVTRRSSKVVRVMAAWVVMAWLFYFASTRLHHTVI